MIAYPNVYLANQADNINGFVSTLSLWEAPSVQPPQGECGPTSQVAINKPVSRNINHTLLMRQSEDYLYYSLNPGKISTDLMVGAVDGDGNRKPRNNCIFYVNQRDTPDTDSNYAKNRAIQLEALLNLENRAETTCVVEVPFAEQLDTRGSCSTLQQQHTLCESYRDAGC